MIMKLFFASRHSSRALGSALAIVFSPLFLFLLVCGFSACSKISEPVDDPLPGGQVSITGQWRVVSWIDGGTSDDSRIGSACNITAVLISFGDASPVPYTYLNGILRFDGRSYSVRQIGETRIELTADDSRGLTVITLEPAAENPDPDPDPDPNPAEGPNEGELNGCTIYPVGSGACKDTYLTLEFPSAPQLGAEGLIRIFRASDNTEVDRIDLAEVAAGHLRMEAGQTINTTHDVIGSTALKRYRIVNYDPITIADRTLTIRPHYDVLEYNTEYYLTIDPEAIVAERFSGVSAGEWRFATKQKPSAAIVTVGERGADFRTVQAALDFGQSLTALEIRIAPGQYEEQLFMRYNNNITLRGMGAGPDDVRIFYRNGDDLNGGVGGSTSVSGNPDSKPKVGDAIPYAGGRTVMLIESCDNVRFENLTLENTRGIGAQAEALYNNDNSGDCGIVAVNCKFLGYQDTLNLKGYCWFYNCLVSGDVDFIWGGATAALFEACEIRVMTDGAYIVNARVSPQHKGFIFLDCRLTKAAGVSAGRSWLARHGNDSNNDNVTYVSCRMDDHIAPAGWYSSDASKFTPSAMTPRQGLKEFGTTTLTGGAYDLSARLSCACALTAADVETYYKDRRTILAGYAKSARWEE